MGIVYRAQDPTIGRIIAIKSIRLNELTDAEERARLRDRLFREAQSAGILSHPNIVTIYDILEEDGLAYIFMECVNGRPLDEILRSVELPANHQLIELLAQTGSALDYAHKRGIIHRDVKPANVMVHEESIAKVCDFGIAKITSQSMTQTGVIMGTPSYMSPEMIKGETLTGASDQFALAIMAYEILTGRKPFTADYLPTLFFKVCSDEPPSIHEANPTLGPLVDRAVRKALAKKPEDRYTTCVEFITVLQRALAGTPDWTPMAKGPMPVLDETTTGSGGRFTPVFVESAAIPAQVHARTSETVAPKPFVREEPEPAPPPPAPPAQVPVQPATMPSMRIPIRDMDRPQPVSASGSPKGLLAAVAAAVLAVIGYFGYSQFSKPAIETPPSPKVVEPVAGSKAGKKASPVTAAKKSPDAKKEVVPPPAIPDPPPLSQKDFEVAFATSPNGAAVTVDGSQTCTSPCPLKLTVGRHGIQVALAGYQTMFRGIEVPKVLDLFIALPEATGILNLSSTPTGASILIDGQTIAEKTPAKLKLREGTHKVEVISGSLRQSQEVVIKQGGVQNLNYQW